ncbi:uncharacterized protein F4822DRAFT_409694 [Hypoxylon trugodes]|uniref:uncharacterized protein n=1 Tax=Hypoxylon trugodes TaxID=326681 RepID=UPI0021944E32|nr:uncharacterized protein F4822DRAFT_409694 [Hypoxylon trugodes]KAI1386340.1 hypothetical protein F4822DRAFT_409694 [Hypoxylon trugodes]
MDSLAEEICLEIAQHLSYEDPQAVLDLRLVNRKWCRVATPCVGICVPRYDDPLPGLFNPLTKLTLGLGERPELAGFIREVVLKKQYILWGHVPLATNSPDQHFLHNSLSALNQASTIPKELQENIVSRLLPTDADEAHLAFILAMCPKLEHIRIPYMSGDCTSRIRRVIRCAREQLLLQASRPYPLITPPTLLCHLRTLHLESYTHGFSVANALDMLTLPKLEHLTLGNLGDEPIITDEAEENALPAITPLPKPALGHYSTNPIDLSFPSCHLSPAGLMTILNACAHLQTLYIKLRTRNNTQQAPTFAQPILYNGQTLHFLHLDTTSFPSGLSQDPNDTTHETSHHLLSVISEMQSLASLIISRRDFDEISDLESNIPESLKEILIIETYQNADEVEQFRRLVRGPRTRGLMRVACLPHTLNCMEGWKDLSEICMMLRQVPPRWMLEEFGCVVYEA